MKNVLIAVAVTAAAAMMLPQQSAAQAYPDCNWCVPCEVDGQEGIETFELGASPYLIAYLGQPNCMAYASGCGHLIQCDQIPETEELLALVHTGHWARIADLIGAYPDQFSLIESRELVAVRDSCGAFVLLEQLPAGGTRAIRSAMALADQPGQ